MTQIGLSLAGDPPDLYLEGNSLVTVAGAEAVAQHAAQRTKTFQGEWFLDTSAGVPWLADVLGKGEANTVLAEALLKTEVNGTLGVTGITEFSLTYDPETRSVAVDRLEIETIYDGDAAQ